MYPGWALLVLLVLPAGRVQVDCSQECGQILGNFEELKRDIAEIKGRYPAGSAEKLYALRIAGYDVSQVVQEPGMERLAAYFAEEQQAIAGWSERMLDMWKGPRSDNPDLMFRLMDKATLDCERQCY